MCTVVLQEVGCLSSQELPKMTHFSTWETLRWASMLNVARQDGETVGAVGDDRLGRLHIRNTGSLLLLAHIFFSRLVFFFFSIFFSAGSRGQAS